MTRIIPIVLLSIASVTSAHARHVASQLPTVPSEIMNAKTVFISNAGEESNAVSQQTVTQLSNGVAESGAYKVVTSPAAADLILEVHYIASLGSPNVQEGGFVSGLSYVYRVRLVVYDRVTHVILWTLTEFLNQNAHKHNFDLELTDSINLLNSELTSLHKGTLSSAPVPTTPTKERFSQEPKN